MLATGACTAPAPAPPAAPPAAPARELTQAERLRVSDATEVLLQRCMRRAGFSYWTSPRLSLEESRPSDYVNDDVEWARKHGYGSRIQAAADRYRRTNPNGAYREGLSPERRRSYDEVLDGGRRARLLTARIPGGTASVHKRLGGCSESAERELYGDPDAWFRADKTVTNLQPLYVSRILRDERFTTALAAWARCMERAGFGYADPSAAREATARTADFAAETRTAVAEARCARETSLAAVARERQSHYLDSLRGTYGGELDAHRRMERRASERAAGITGPRT
ncbi:hypothetical protein VO63_36230 [Streptomyces showdoensis]|uniref:Uncharacterized protein n=1 Tax=Streptomyces showdoensis TaxID=68268 RepID=A0A2P2GCA9_STREW|nr:hypothetical protein VO63_36230 [Streptomyces showdoensis]